MEDLQYPRWPLPYGEWLFSPASYDTFCVADGVL